MLAEPGWLLLAMPVFLVWWYRPQPSRWLQGLRAATWVLVFLALAGLALPQRRYEGVLVVLADRSASMPPQADARHKEVLDWLYRSRRGHEQLAVIGFGKHAVVEQPPSEAPFRDFVHKVDGDGSALAAALDKALEILPPDRPGRILVLSDGRWTGVEPTTWVSRLATRRIAVDYRLQSRSSVGDLAIAAVEAPSQVAPGSGFLLSAWIEVPSPQKVRAELVLNDTVVGTLEKEYPAGRHRIAFRTRGREPGTQEYRLRISGEANDPVPENNTARVLVRVAGPKRLLHVAAIPGGGLAHLLEQAGFHVTSRKPQDWRWDLQTLSDFSCVILENVAAEQIGAPGLNVLAHWVRDAGGGLMMTGGRNSYAVGGYYGSPLEEVLPVSLEMREEQRKFTAAIVLVLDRSGSMSASVGGGKVKMDLANRGAAQILDLLHPRDEIGVIAVDSAPHVITPLVHPTHKTPLRQKILSIQSQGGGIFVYTGLLEAARMIQDAKAATRHIILFADAADAEEPGDYVKLLAALREAGVTVSVIGLGTERDKDAEFLRDVARRGNGNIYFTNRPEELPLLFAQDAFRILRSSFVEEITPVTAEAGLRSLTPRPFHIAEPVGGYNLCYLKPEAVRAAVTQDEFRAPLVAAWHRGLGRVVCYTAEVDGKYTGPIARWAEYGDFLVSLAQWAAGAQQGLPSTMAVTQEVIRGGVRIRLYLDPEAELPPFTQPPTVWVLKQHQDGRLEREQHRLSWVEADLLELQLPLAGNDTLLATLHLAGHGPVSLPPTCLPYSSEFDPAPAEVGAKALAQLALATGGVERADLTTIWQDLPASRVHYPLRPWLLGLALLTLLLEILERRTGWLTSATAGVPAARWIFAFRRAGDAARNVVGWVASLVRRPTATADDTATADRTEPVKAQAPPPARPQGSPAARPTPPLPKPTQQEPAASEPSLLAALQQARRRSQQRMPPGQSPP